jgi:DNA invertase Pin-like site-specific DNA recombinase
MRLAVAYYRVSTSRQGKSGLGLKAQQAAARNYCALNGYTLLQEIQEIKSTRKLRPGLLEALALCRKSKATLIVTRLDRLGRDVEQIAGIVKSSVEIIVTDNPHANRFTIHILAAVAEEQRRTISINTRDALQAAKRRGRRLGKNGINLSKANKKNADEFARKMKPLIEQLKKEGFTTLRAIAEELNRRKIPTFRKGSQWHATSLHNLLKRL